MCRYAGLSWPRRLVLTFIIPRPAAASFASIDSASMLIPAICPQSPTDHTRSTSSRTTLYVAFRNEQQQSTHMPGTTASREKTGLSICQPTSSWTFDRSCLLAKEAVRSSVDHSIPSTACPSFNSGEVFQLLSARAQPLSTSINAALWAPGHSAMTRAPLQLPQGPFKRSERTRLWRSRRIRISCVSCTHCPSMPRSTASSMCQSDNRLQRCFTALDNDNSAPHWRCAVECLGPWIHRSQVSATSSTLHSAPASGSPVAKSCEC